jgi:hypothetical protein
MNRLLNYFISKNIFKLEEIGIKESYKIKFLNLSNFNINKENIEDTINNLNNIIINNKNFVIEINEMIKTTTIKDYNTNYNYLEIAEKIPLLMKNQMFILMIHPHINVWVY